jgi:hypothetical protein
MDEDGEAVYLRVADIAMIAVPQCLLKPELLDDEDDELAEKEPVSQSPDSPLLVQ